MATTAGRRGLVAKGMAAARLAAGRALAVGLVLAAATGAAFAETRLALVIGNSAYAVRPLPNPKNDAALMSETLKGAGFEVTTLIDADQALMKRAILDFGRRLRSSDSVGLFYYAGHGVQAGGENYLIPVSADIADLEEVALNGVSLTELMKTMERSGSRLNIAILDACRDNPFASSTRSAAGGLAPVSAPTGTLIAYATGPGHVAYDGTGANSPYTSALVEAIPSEGAPVEDVFRRARRKVLELTDGKQTPWEHSSLTGEFYFKPKIADPQSAARLDDRPPPAADKRLAEIEAWETIKTSTDADVLRRHIESYPNGVFTELAMYRLKGLETYTAGWTSIVTGSTPAKAATVPGEDLYEQAVKLDAPNAKLADLERAASLYRAAAEAGLPAAMFNLARAYDKGRGVVRDLETAALWYRNAADKGHAGAMASLGSMFEHGEGVERDGDEAFRLYGLAAEKGDANAMASLGYLYQSGTGTSRNPGLARDWYQKAVAEKQPRAMFNLALMHIKGEGGKIDLVAGVRLLQLAANAGHAGSQRELASLYDEGRGLARDHGKAADYLLTAYKAGDPQARRDLLERPDAWSFSTRRQVQKKLAQKGFSPGPAIGFFTAKTRQALEKFGSQS